METFHEQMSIAVKFVSKVVEGLRSTLNLSFLPVLVLPTEGLLFFLGAYRETRAYSGETSRDIASFE